MNILMGHGTSKQGSVDSTGWLGSVSRPCYEYDSKCFFYNIFGLMYLYGVGIENHSS